MRTRTIARTAAVALMGVLVLGATVDGFSQSWAGLYEWALQHQLSGWKAMAFPGMVDAFVGIGELGMFLLAIDGHKLRRSLLSWADLLLPAAVAASGWGASLVFNVGRVDHHGFATEATAAVPPIASMVGLVVLLRTLHRYVTAAETAVDRQNPVTAPLELSAAPEDLELDRAPSIDDEDAELMAWLRGDPVPAVPPTPDPHHIAAVEAFGNEIRAGRVPGIHRIKRTLRIGQPKAQQVRDYLSTITTK